VSSHELTRLSWNDKCRWAHPAGAASAIETACRHSCYAALLLALREGFRMTAPSKRMPKGSRKSGNGFSEKDMRKSEI
jgi:hypothetical protein